jgi:hypothetical protein
MSKSQDLDTLRTTVMDFIKDLSEVFDMNDEKGDLVAVEIYFGILHRERIMNHVIDHILPHKKNIEGRKINFFKKHSDVLFKGVDTNRVPHYKDAILSGRISTTDITAIWEYLDTMIALAESYQSPK